VLGLRRSPVVDYDDRVEIEVESTVQLGGGPRLSCLDAVRTEPDVPLGDRVLLNASGLSIRVVADGFAGLEALYRGSSRLARASL